MRMAPQLREALRDAADNAGCSMNAFAVQVLAAAAGDPARFRVPKSAKEVAADDIDALDDLERDPLGYPLAWHERGEHMAARGEFVAVMDSELGTSEMVALVKHLDREDPAHFVRWMRIRRAESAGPGSEDHRDVA